MRQDLIRHVSLAILTLVLASSCTQESKIKSLALESAEKVLITEIKSEAQNKLKTDSTFQENYVSVIKNKIELEIGSVSIQGNSATVEIKYKIVPDNVRQSLIEIINSQKDKSAYSFNTYDALNLVYGQLKLPLGTTTLRNGVVQLKNSQEWRVTKTPHNIVTGH